MFRPKDLVPADVTHIDPLLVTLLGLCTPHGHEQHIARVINQQSFVKTNVKSMMYDKEMNNKILVVGDGNTLFSCHMDIIGKVGKHNVEKNKVDTIFLMEQPDEPKNVGIYYGAKGFPNKTTNILDSFEGCPLGADDKLGVYILLKMIQANIPGMYVFHTGEECGGKGSRSLVEHHPKLFAKMERAIAFDRANYGDVISFQRSSRCCSEEFGLALAQALNVSMPPKQLFKSEIRGTFTDTASYTKLIPECTNISVGYFDQHGDTEHFDYIWLKDHLLPAILAIDFEKLPTKRDPKAVAVTVYHNYNHYSSPYKHVPTKRVPWADATVKTSYLEFPEWQPELGAVEDADPAVLQMAVNRYLANLYGPKKDAFTDWLINLMEFQAALQEEIEVLEIALEKATGVLRPVKADILTRVIALAESPQIVLHGDYNKWLSNYILGAKKLLTKPKPKPEKYNRILFAISVLLDSSEMHTKELEVLLKEVEEYIITHHKEQGFEVNKRLTQIQEKPKEPEYNYDIYC